MDFKASWELWNPPSKAVPDQFRGSGVYSKHNCLQDRASFHRSRDGNLSQILTLLIIMFLLLFFYNLGGGFFLFKINYLAMGESQWSNSEGYKARQDHLVNQSKTISQLVGYITGSWSTLHDWIHTSCCLCTTVQCEIVSLFYTGVGDILKEPNLATAIH